MRLAVLIMLLSLAACSAEGMSDKVVELSFSKGRVSAIFSKAPVQEVARLIAHETHVVVKVYDGVGGLVDGEFENIPLNQFLRKVFKPYNTSFAYAGRQNKNIKGVFVLNEGGDVAKAKVFLPKQGASMLSKFAQYQQSVAPVSDATVISAAENVERSDQKRRLDLYLDDLKRQLAVAKQKKEDFSGLQQKIDELEMREARLERIPAHTMLPKRNRPESLQKYSGF